jgi:hypothetical protein
MGEMKHVYKILFGKSEGESQLTIPRHRSENNIKLDLAIDRLGICAATIYLVQAGPVAGSFKRRNENSGSIYIAGHLLTS